MRHWTIHTFIGLGLAAGCGSAVAAAPQAADTTIEASFCPSAAGPVRLDLTGKVQPINLPGGRQIVASPNLRVTVTTLANGNSASYVITGATHLEALTNNNIKVTLTGRNLVIVPQANGHPAGLFLSTGMVSFVVDALGNEVELFSGTGRVLDVCQALA